MSELFRLSDFLGVTTCAELLQYAVAAKSQFRHTTVDRMAEPSLHIRRSVRLQNIGELHTVVEQRIQRVIPDLTRELGLSPFETGQIDIEMVAHADGGFYKRHIDTFTGDTRSESGDRIISCVYYFFKQPKSFSGGELRLYPLRTAANPMPEAIDIAIENDTLVAFSSWMPHEVLPVCNPSPAFEDSRFSINCWVYRVPAKRA
jgi:SM-20-related protein